MPSHGLAAEEAGVKLRSLLFVPGNRPERFGKALASGADAVILDLEDAVAPAAKPKARDAVAAFLAGPRGGRVFVRINPLDGDSADEDLAAAVGADGIVLPKAEGAESVRRLDALLGDSAVPILPIATETSRAIFQLGSYADVATHLAGLTWGAEDLPAAIGAATSREADGRYTPPYELVRSLALFAAHAADVAAIDTVYPALKDADGLAAYAGRAARDGFTGMLALHPAQVETINRAFTPDADTLDRARRIAEAFEREPGAGALQVDGRMVDAPHLKQALRLLSLGERSKG
ncbi:Hydroxymethylglutaryl-CoA lyase [plant metagenome]|uniref:Hydroxymethylglutaryl-CoA lyase n=1 Tax=plant metagenome TaxID=1297885 RepID=A0A484SG01_9ZZZZ